jgi:probable F420-dependent oxidoreductase
MKIGMMVPHAGLDASPAAIKDVAQAAEDLGLDSLWATDHVILPKTYSSPYPFRPDQKMRWSGAEPYYELFATLAFLSAATNRITLGSATCIVPYRPPVLLAKSVATLDQLSGGRLVLGAGVGWLREEFDALGADFATRGAATDESLALLRHALRPEQPVSFRGTYVELEDCYFSPRSFADRALPLWIGGNSAAALRRTAEVGSAWFPHMYGSDPAALRRGMGRIAELRSPAMRDVPVELALFVPLRLAARSGSAPLAPAWQSQALTGSPGEVASAFSAYQEAGVDHIVVSSVGAPDVLIETMRRLLDDVLPACAVS